MAKFLGKDVEDIREEDGGSVIYNYDNYSGNYSASNNYFINVPESMLKNQQEYIELLKQKISDLEEKINQLTDLNLG